MDQLKSESLSHFSILKYSFSFSLDYFWFFGLEKLEMQSKGDEEVPIDSR